jgi:tetratricopeptide (TPR) repeat protein
MVLSLAGRRRWLFPASLIVFAGLYLLLAGVEFAASYLAARADLADLQRATRLSPGNADYHHRLGRYFAFAAPNPSAALDHYQSAVQLNPHQASYWLDLASAQQVAGNPAGQLEAIEAALHAEPTAPHVAWEAANFFLLAGDQERALREFRVVIENDVGLVDYAFAPAALQYCWRVRPDVDALLRDVVPSRPDTLIGFLNFLASKHETEGTIKTWDRLVQLHEKFESRYLFEYVGYLIQAHRPDAAMAAWEQASGILDLSAYLPTRDNLVVNPDFSLDILNAGFDWTYVNRTGVRPLLDPTDFREGHRSLSITFEGPGINDAGIQQLIPVRSGTTYDFSAYYKSSEFEGAGGPQIVLRDAYSGVPLFASDSLTGADIWKEVQSRITVPGSTTLLALKIERFPAGSPIRGKLWLDSFALSPAAVKESP